MAAAALVNYFNVVWCFLKAPVCKHSSRHQQRRSSVKLPEGRRSTSNNGKFRNISLNRNLSVDSVGSERFELFLSYFIDNLELCINFLNPCQLDWNHTYSTRPHPTINLKPWAKNPSRYGFDKQIGWRITIYEIFSNKTLLEKVYKILSFYLNSIFSVNNVWGELVRFQGISI